MTYGNPPECRRAHARSEPARDARRPGWDDPVIYVLGLLVGAIPVVAAVLRGDRWGVEATTGLSIAVFSLGGLVRCVLGR